MITEALKPLINSQVLIDIKAQSVYDGLLRPAGPFRTIIRAIEGPGVVLQDASFIPWSNINGIAPFKSPDRGRTIRGDMSNVQREEERQEGRQEEVSRPI